MDEGNIAPFDDEEVDSCQAIGLVKTSLFPIEKLTSFRLMPGIASATYQDLNKEQKALLCCLPN